MSLSTAPATPVRIEEVSLIREGDIWTLERRGTAVRLRHIIGLDHLAVLLSTPGTEFPALELGGGDTRDGGRADILDRRAIRDIKERLRDLEAEIATTCDQQRSTRARAEFDQITAHLASCLGLGNSPRRFVSASERARTRVTKAIRSAIGRIVDVDAALGNHLTSAVSTGAFCVYRPDPTSTIRWRVAV